MTKHLTHILHIDDLDIEVTRKKVKNINLSVKKNGEITVSMPYHTKMETMETFVRSKIPWIKKIQSKINISIHQKTQQFINNEQHFLWGKPYYLRIEISYQYKIKLIENQIIIRLPENNTVAQRQHLLDKFYNQSVKIKLLPLLTLWINRMKTPYPTISIRKMTSRWGSCTPAKKSIRINSELAKYPIECLEYVLVHELTHFYHTGHGAAFVATMNKFMPDWQKRKTLLKNFFRQPEILDKA